MGITYPGHLLTLGAACLALSAGCTGVVFAPPHTDGGFDGATITDAQAPPPDGSTPAQDGEPSWDGATGTDASESLCGDESCDPGEDCTSCPADCGPCPPMCGDESCDPGEDCASCPGDCGPCPPVCGDSVCDASENPWDCSEDCGMPAIPAGFAGVLWLHTNVSGWSETATLQPIYVSGGLICLEYDKASLWPGVDHVGAFVNANPWIFIFHQGTLYAATWEWMRHGQTCKNRTAVAGDHIKKDPFWDFQPRSGTWYGFMVSGLARDATRNVYERSNVQLYRWP